MSATDEVLKANEEYARNFTLGHLPLPPARSTHHLGPWPQIKVVGVGEQHLDAQPLEVVLGDALDGAGGADGHEHGCLDNSVWRVQQTRPRPGGRVAGHNLKSQLVRHVNTRPQQNAWSSSRVFRGVSGKLQREEAACASRTSFSFPVFTS